MNKKIGAGIAVLVIILVIVAVKFIKFGEVISEPSVVPEQSNISEPIIVSEPSAWEINPQFCNQDSDCVCKEEGGFQGNIDYYNAKVNKSTYLADSCSNMGVSLEGTPLSSTVVGKCVTNECVFEWVTTEST